MNMQLPITVFEILTHLATKYLVFVAKHRCLTPPTA